MRCEEVFDNLTDLLDGTLPPEVEANMLEHLATCERCEIILAETRSLVDLAVEERPIELGPDVRAALLGRILSGLPQRRQPG